MTITIIIINIQSFTCTIKTLYNKRDKVKIHNADDIKKLYIFMLNHCISKLGLIKSTKIKSGPNRDKHKYTIVEEKKARYDNLNKIMKADKEYIEPTETVINFICEMKEDEDDEEEESVP